MSNELLETKENITKLNMLINTLEKAIVKHKYMCRAYKSHVKLEFKIKLINLDIFKNTDADTLEEVKADECARLTKDKRDESIAINDLLKSEGHNIHLQNELDHGFLVNLTHIVKSEIRCRIKSRTKNIYEIQSLFELTDRIDHFKYIINEHHISNDNIPDCEHEEMKRWGRSKDESLSYCQLYLINGIAEIAKK